MIEAMEDIAKTIGPARKDFNGTTPAVSGESPSPDKTEENYGDRGRGLVVKRTTISADSVVIAVGVTSVNHLEEELKTIAPVKVIGDAKSPGPP